MKYSIPVKFIAIILCAACLLAAVGSGLGIVILAENGLYDRTPRELYAEQMEAQAYGYAENLAQNYASIHLGGCPEEMLSHYSPFVSGSYGYTLMDADGNVLDELTLENPEGSFCCRFEVSGSYMKVLNTYGSSSGSTSVSANNYVIYDAIADESSLVFNISCTYQEDSASTGSDGPIGYLEHTEDGRAHFVSFDPYILDLPEIINPSHMAFLDANGDLIYEISNEGGVGELFCDEAGLVHFTAAVTSALVVAQSDVEPIQATEPAAEAVAANVNYFSYFDAALGHEVTVEYDWEVMPRYTVAMELLPDATYEGHYYTALGYLRVYRHNYPWLLGIGLLLFAVTLVYLCCAAGRKPGTDEIRPRALNRLPLDLYLAVDAAAVSGLAVACVEGGAALFRDNAMVGLGFVGITGYAMALICVAYIFAFAAQVKSRNRYWLRNTICGRVLILIFRFIRWTDRWAHKVWPKFCAGAGSCWNGLKRGVVKTYLFIEKVLIASCLFLFKAVKTIWKYGCIFVGKTCRFIGRNLRRFFALLPLTWQWLLTGFVMIFLLFIGAAGRREGLLVFSICGSVAIILYGAHCFGVLLESAKKMRRGDLDTKVDDRLLLGSFRDFSDELNGLAGVTNVAVQKQLKSERMKTELITNVSHDIKTPLTSIINYVDLMKLPHGEEEHELYLEVLDRQSQRLKKLIEDLMEMSKASTGNIAVDLIPLNAAEAVNQALGEFSDKFHSVNLTPVFHQPEEPVTILADGRLIWRVLSNLLSNAYKYALPGTRLYLDLMVLDGKAVITIKNISKEQLNVDAGELMERFVRGDASRNTEGSGLGLNIAKSLVELQQGQMELMVDGDLFKVTLLFPLA